MAPRNQAELAIVVKARDEAADLARAAKRIDSLEKEVESLGRAMDRASKNSAQFGASLNKIDSATGALSRGLGGLATAIGAVGLAELTRRIVELGASGERLLSLDAAFEHTARNLGSSTDAILSSMKEASGGLISESDLILKANQAVALGVADSADDFATLLEVAAKRGAAFGRTATEAFDDIVIGIGRQSKLILDNIGIELDAAAANREYAEALGESADALTDAEKKQAALAQVVKRTREELGSGTGEIENQIGGVGRLTRAWQDYREELAKQAAITFQAPANLLADALDHMREDIADRGLVGSLFPDIQDAVRGIQHEFSELGKIEGQLRGAENLLQKLISGREQLLSTRNEAGVIIVDPAELERQNRLINQAQADVTLYSARISAMTGNFRTAKDESEFLNSALRDTAQAMEEAGESAGNLAQLTERGIAALKTQALGLVDALGAEEALALFERQKQAFEAAVSSLDFDTDTEAEFAIRALTEQFREQTQAISSNAAVAREYEAALEQALGVDASSQTISIEDLSSALQNASVSASGLGAQSEAAGGGIASMARQIVGAIGALREFQAQANAAIGAQTERLQQIGRLRESAERSIVSRARGIIDIVGSDRAIAIARERINLLREETATIAEQGKQGIELDLTYAGLTNTLLGPFEQIKANQRATEQWGQSVRGAVSSAFEDLRGKVSSVLAGSLDVGVGVNPDDILGRPDAINENARRLADVAVRGFDSPWAAYLNDEFPNLFGAAFEGGDIKTRAAELLRDFEDGLRPELLDKTIAKERVRRMIVGDANMKALADEITAELAAEFGAQAPANLGSLVDAGLGIDDSENAGLDAGAAFRKGMFEDIQKSAVGGQIIGTVTGQIDSNLTGMAASGAQAGDAFVSSALTAVESRQAEVDSAKQALGSTIDSIGGFDPANLFDPISTIDIADSAGIDAGVAFGRSAVGAITDEGSGITAVNIFVDQMRSVYARISRAGRDAGLAWGGGFMETVEEGVQGPLIRLLVDLVTPGVREQIRTESTQTAAG